MQSKKEMICGSGPNNGRLNFSMQFKGIWWILQGKGNVQEEYIRFKVSEKSIFLDHGYLHKICNGLVLYISVDTITTSIWHLLSQIIPTHKNSFIKMINYIGEISSTPLNCPGIFSLNVTPSLKMVEIP